VAIVFTAAVVLRRADVQFVVGRKTVLSATGKHCA